MSDQVPVNMSSEAFSELVTDHLALAETRSGNKAAINWGAIGGVVQKVDEATQKVMPVLNTLLPAQWDAIAKLVATGIHAASTGLNPTS